MRSLAITISFALTTTLMAHSVQTNSEGCHAGKQPYHCHSGSTYTEPEKAKRWGETYRPSKSNSGSKSYKHKKPSKSKTKKKLSSKNKQGEVIKFYNKLIANPNSAVHEISDLIETVRKNPNIVTSCDEWYLMAQLLRMVKRVDATVPEIIDKECRRIGLRKFSQLMKSMLNQLQ